jgi:rubredoxin
MKLLRNVHEVLKSMKHNKPAQICCPRCYSPKITLYNTLDVWFTPAKYVCEACGYLGPIVMELEKPEKEEESS